MRFTILRTDGCLEVVPAIGVIAYLEYAPELIHKIYVRKDEKEDDMNLLKLFEDDEENDEWEDSEDD